MTPELASLWQQYRDLQSEGPGFRTLAVLKAINLEDPADLDVYRLLAALYRSMNLTEECMDQYRILVQYLLTEHGTRAEDAAASRHSSAEDEYVAIVRQQIAGGESRNREFKSTLRKNLKSGSHDDAITDAVLKTIAAFLNTDGGMLYIGVADDGAVLGLANDAFPSQDELQLFLNDKVKTHLSVLAASSLHTSIVAIGAAKEEVCVVECRKSEKLVFMTSGKYRDVCFVRTGPATVELPPSQLLDYATARSRKTSGES